MVGIRKVSIFVSQNKQIMTTQKNFQLVKTPNAKGFLYEIKDENGVVVGEKQDKRDFVCACVTSQDELSAENQSFFNFFGRLELMYKSIDYRVDRNDKTGYYKFFNFATI